MLKRKKILIVDDIELNRLLLDELFHTAYDVLEASNGKEALEYIEKYRDEIAIILLDIIMPVMDGFEVLKNMNDTGDIKSIPVILITGENDDEKALTGYELGISDLINKPFNPEIVLKRVGNIVDLYSHKENLEEKLRQQKERLERQERRIKQSNQFVIDALSTTVEFRSLESGEHIKRVRVLTKVLLEQSSKYYPLTQQEIEIISSASAMHDIGKIAIPDAILLKPGRLTTEEFEVMKTHTTKGCDILNTLNYMQDKVYFNYCYEICRHHHERWDGRGYPDKLKGDEISIWAQATALADVYDALTSARVYKAAYTHEQACDMIIKGECGEFNPKLLDCFLNVKDTLNETINAPIAGVNMEMDEDEYEDDITED
ncbi:MAG: response regulator [Oscillospiraceae bacterium]|jgi:putative two-component system response regulator|nr:response regulator [Oscillospiraceae bacterium]